MTEERNEDYVKQLGLRHEIDTREKLLDNHFDFQGGILQYHQWVTLSLGFLLIHLAFMYDQGAFIYFYALGMVKVVKDALKTAESLTMQGVKALETRPLTWYVIGALLAWVTWTSIGASTPDMAFGLFNNASEVTQFGQ